MRIGKLRRVVTIQAPTQGQSGTGAPTQTWATLANGANLFAEILEEAGREQIQAGQVNPQRPVTVRIRYLAGVTAQQRVLYGSRTFQIMSVVNVNERSRELELTCLES